MPSFSSRKPPFKLLNMGDSGTGKTSALMSLINTGYELFILDYDNGTDIFYSPGMLKIANPKAHIEYLQDKYGLIEERKAIGVEFPTAFSKGISLLSSKGWIDSETKESFGKITEWDTSQKRIICLDTLNFMGKAAMNFVLKNHGHHGQNPTQPDWGVAMKYLENTLGILCSAEIKCHVIVNTHITYQTPESGGLMKGFPKALGQKLPEDVPGYFNTVLYSKTEGKGDETKRYIYTKPEGNIDVKCILTNAPKRLPQESALATLFDIWEKS